MKAISLHQPWASGIALHLKTIETRGWPTKYRGPLAIHAAKRWAREQRTFTAAEQNLGRLPREIPLGVILAIADLVDVAPTTNLLPGPVEKLYGNYGERRFGWMLENVVTFDAPVPFAGLQGFFNVPDELLPWQPMTTAPKDGSEVELLLRHKNWQYAQGEEKRQWQGPYRAKWINFNGGGWTWHGMAGNPIAWRTPR